MLQQDGKQHAVSLILIHVTATQCSDTLQGLNWLLKTIVMIQNFVKKVMSITPEGCLTAVWLVIVEQGLAKSHQLAFNSKRPVLPIVEKVTCQCYLQNFAGTTWFVQLDS